MGGTTTPMQATQQITDASQQAGWQQAAETAAPSASSPATPAPPAASPAAGAPATTTGAGAPAGVTFPQTTPPPSTAPVVTSQKRTGIMGVIDSITDALTGRTTPEIGTDPAGNQYVKQRTLTHGEQWLRIGAEALHGAAADLAASRGAGNMGKGMLAAVNAGQEDADRAKQNEQQMDAKARQQNLDNANNQMLRQNMAEQAWRFARLKQQATQANVDWANGQVDRLVKEGGVILGNAAHAADIGGILKANPDVMKDMIQKHQIEIMPHYDEDGNPAGITVVKMPNGYRSQVLPAGTVFHTFDGTTGKLVEHESADPMTAGERDDYEHQAGIEQMKFQNDKAEQDLKTQQAAEAKANAGKAPSEIREAGARTAQAYAAATKDLADAARTKQQINDEPLVDAIGSGHVVPERLAYLLARNPALLQEVVQKYPGFDTGKAESYPAVYKDFTSTKKGSTGAALNAGGTALEHLQELSDLNTAKSHIPGTSDYNAYRNKADTVATELATFYGDATIPAIASIKSTLMATLPGNRQSAIRTQAQSMGDKLDNYEQSWRNAAPSAAYEAPMPNISQKAINARMTLDPRYKLRAPTPTAPGTPQKAAPVSVIPGEATATAADGTLLVVRNHQWVPAVHQ